MLKSPEREGTDDFQSRVDTNCLLRTERQRDREKGQREMKERYSKEEKVRKGRERKRNNVNTT